VKFSSILIPHTIVSGDPRIYCRGTELKELPKVLEQLNGTNFQELIIYNTSITAINENSFGNENFYEYIHVAHNDQLKNINLHSFKTGPQQLSISENKRLSEDMIFGLIKNCENAQKLYLEGSHITEIPSFAFKLNKGSVKRKLKEIDLKNNKIRKIGKF
jgi:hypothetical protein